MSDYDIYGAAPAKLKRLMANLHRMNADNNLNNYECLGQQWLVGSRVSRDNRLIKNIHHGVIKESAIPRMKGLCVCDQDIKYNCIIRHVSNRSIFVIGSCCYKALTEKESRKQLCTAEGCFNRHSNQNYTVCNEHKAVLIKQKKEEEKLQKQQRAHEQARVLALERLRDYQRSQLERIGNKKFGFGKTFNNFRIKDLTSDYVSWVEGWAKDKQSNDYRIEELLRYQHLKEILA